MMLVDVSSELHVVYDVSQNFKMALFWS